MGGCYWIDGQTWKTTLPGASIKSSIMVYTQRSVGLRIEPVPAMNTYFCFGTDSRNPSKLFEMPRLPLVGGETGFGERFTNEILRNERFDVVDIESVVGLKPRLDDLQLRSSGIDVDHSE